MTEDFFADGELAELVAVDRTIPATASIDVVARRAAARERARQRPPGPDMATVDGTIRGVPVRRYQPGRPLTIMYLHGGAFILGDLETHDAQARRLAAGTGTSVVAVDYRLAPEHPWPAAVDDALAVLDGLTEHEREHEREHEHEHRDVAIAGDSAGGLIAALAAREWPGRPGFQLKALLLVCPNTDLTLSQPSVATKGHGYLLDVDDLRWSIAQWVPDPADRNRASPLATDVADLATMPPTVIVTAEHDPLHDEGAAYAERLRLVGAPVVQRNERGMLHNFPALRHRSPAAAAAEDRFIADARAILSLRP
jgi:acetyl esterase